MELEMREASKKDLIELLQLYTQLHDNAMPELNEQIDIIWNGILADPNHHVVVACMDGIIISSCILIVVPNLTHGQRPYALVENVITHAQYRGRGYASAVLNFAKQLAEKNNCYKIMLLTGSKKESTINFYERVGYNRHDKTALIQWL